MDYATSFAFANPGTDYPVKMGQVLDQLSLDSDKVDSGAVGHAFGYKRNTTAGLNVGYYGGVIISGGVLTTIADGTIALTDETTNYVERTKAGVVSKNTVGFTAGQLPMFTAVTAAGAVTAVTDKRQRNVFGDLSAVGDLDVAGNIGVGGAANASAGIIVNNAALTGVSQFGVYSGVIGSNAATTSIRAFQASPQTAAAAFTCVDVIGYKSNNPTKGAGSTITNAAGFLVEDLTAGTNNYGFMGGVSAGANKYNLYMDGTAANLLAGGVILSATAGDTALNRSVEGSWVTNCSGAIATTQSIYYSRVGKKVTLHFTATRVAGNSSATPISCSGLPAALYPVNGVYGSVPLVTDNGADLTSPGVVSISSAGAITIYKNGALGAFTSSAAITGFYGFSISYEVP